MNVRTDIVAASDQSEMPAHRTFRWGELMPGLMMMADALTILIAASVSHLVLVDSSSYVDQFYVFAAGFVLLSSLLLLRSGGMYSAQALLSIGRSFDTVIVAIATSFVFLLTILHALKTWALYQTDWLLAFAMAVTLGLVLLRIIAGAVLRNLLQRGRIGRRTAVVGTSAHVLRFLKCLNENQSSLTAVTAVYDPKRVRSGTVPEDTPVAGNLHDLIRAARQHAFDDIVVALPDTEAKLCSEVIERLRELPVDVYLAPQLTEFGLRLRPTNHQGALPMFEVWQRPIAGWSRFLKMAEDYLLAGLILILLLPVLGLISLAIWLDTGGPVLFRQKRLGFNNEVFEIFKFRTMHHRIIPESAVVQATRRDPRITRVGWYLRRTSLDELPQLLNVLNGTMSLVGPRPHALSHNADFSGAVRGYFGRHKVKPGITGWAQVNGLRGEIDSHDKLVARISHDVHYAENWSIFFDLRILVVTAIVVLFQRNAY